MSIVGPSAHPVCEICLSRGPIAALDVRPDDDARATVVLVPGYTGSKEDFGPVLDAVVARGRRSVAVDLRGQHQSPGPDDESAYAVDLLGAELVELCATLGDGPVHLLGHSFGGLVARAAVLQDPGAFCSLTLLGSGPAAVAGATAERVRTLRTLLSTMTLEEIADLTDATDPVAAARPADVRAFLRTRFVSTRPASFHGMGEAILTEPDRVVDLRGTGLPVLVTHGDGDDVWPPSVQRDMAHRLGATYAVIEGALHSPAVERPADLAAALDSFWSAVESATVGER